MHDFPSFHPSNIDGIPGLTYDEMIELVTDQDLRWKALQDAERKQKRLQPRRR